MWHVGLRGTSLGGVADLSLLPRCPGLAGLPTQMPAPGPLHLLVLPLGMHDPHISLRAGVTAWEQRSGHLYHRLSPHAVPPSSCPSVPAERTARPWCVKTNFMVCLPHEDVSPRRWEQTSLAEASQLHSQARECTWPLVGVQQMPVSK